MITQTQIQAISDPIEKVYENIVDALLVNIGKHLTDTHWTHTAVWEVQKLSELGQLTEENAAIINSYIKAIPAEMRDAMEATRRAALDKLETQLNAAVKSGALPAPIADNTERVFQQYAEQAVDKLNLVNTTMLQSSIEQYERAVQLTAQLQERQNATQDILNAAAGQVLTGAQTRTQALRDAIRKISDEGLTGFYDRAGRAWSPEAYVNMNIRTTVHNAAIQSTRVFMEDYGANVFQVSSHAGARPLCYPYQGKFYSWDNSSGTVELGNGSVVSYEPLNSTSYGQAAGLFGINCGHYPIPIVPGVTIPHGADNIQDPEENAKAYAESQEQRRLEREIREAKRVVEMLGETATDADRQAVRDAQADMRKFIAETGRSRRYDRESIGTFSNIATFTFGEKRAIIDNEVTKAARADSVIANPVTRLPQPLTQEEIIAKVSGGDNTDGSCGSCLLAYAGNQAGFDVLDFRGGASCDFFAQDDTIEKLANLSGVVSWELNQRSEYTMANTLLKHVEPGKEYGLYVGQHAAVVRKNGQNYEYLELQSPIASENTFYTITHNELQDRFGCIVNSAYLGGYYTSYAALIDLATLEASPDFEAVLAYINTASSVQNKGVTGSVR